MTKKLTIAGLVLAAAASSAVAFGAAPAKAGCLTSTGTAGTPGYNPCTTFDPATSSSVVNYQGFTGTGNNGTSYTKFRVGFRVDSTSAVFPVSFPNGSTIEGPGTGGGASGNVNPVSVPSTGFGGLTYGPYVNLATAQTGGSFDFSDYKLSFDFNSITGITSNVTVYAYLQFVDDDYFNSAGAIGNQQTAGNPFSVTYTYTAPPAGTPGPLPILGAGAAFGFTRRLRKQIKLAA